MSCVFLTLKNICLCLKALVRFRKVMVNVSNVLVYSVDTFMSHDIFLWYYFMFALGDLCTILEPPHSHS